MEAESWRMSLKLIQVLYSRHRKEQVPGGEVREMQHIPDVENV